MIYTGPCFIMGKMQKLPSPIKQIYSLSPFKKQYLSEKSFNQEEPSEIKASRYTQHYFFFLDSH